jgi:16S rRNA (uracil1498-N3)-methyltransferase
VLRLFVPGRPAPDGTVRVTGAEFRHLRTLRLGPGDRFRLFDDAGAEHEVAVERVGARDAVVRVLRSSTASRESPLALTLGVALLKQDKMDWVVEKATELGAARIVPLETRYVVARGDHAARWRRVAVAAAKQSGRTRLPVVDAPTPLARWLPDAGDGLRLLAWEDEAACRLADVADRADAVAIAIGPEGGFHPDEVAAARAAGFRTVTLGRRVLRAETAAVAAVALCQHRWGDG